jgi:hypothetical protein
LNGTEYANNFRSERPDYEYDAILFHMRNFNPETVSSKVSMQNTVSKSDFFITINCAWYTVLYCKICTGTVSER